MSLFARIPRKDSLAYLLRSALHYPSARYRRCPSCGASDYGEVSRKAMVTVLVRCQSCRLLYRVPQDPPGLMQEHYQEDYASGGLTTSVPAQARLEALIASGFKGSDKDFTQKIGVLAALGVAPGARVLDFGASWGYGVFQLGAAGYRAEGYEISAPRAAYGVDKLGVTIHTSANAVGGGYDAIFSSHVIEHFSDPSEALEMARVLLRPGGVFMAFTPNGSLRQIPGNRRVFEKHWGRLHPVHLDEEYLLGQLGDVPSLITSRPYGGWRDVDELGRWDQRSNHLGDLGQSELLTVFINSPGG